MLKSLYSESSQISVFLYRFFVVVFIKGGDNLNSLQLINDVDREP